MCNTQDMEKYFEMYVGDLEKISTSLVPYISPLEAPYLGGMPPAYIETAQYDCLHDEGVQYAQALESNGVPIELHEIKDAMHGYDIARNSLFVSIN